MSLPASPGLFQAPFTCLSSQLLRPACVCVCVCVHACVRACVRVCVWPSPSRCLPFSYSVSLLIAASASLCVSPSMCVCPWFVTAHPSVSTSLPRSPLLPSSPLYVSFSLSVSVTLFHYLPSWLLCLIAALPWVPLIFGVCLPSLTTSLGGWDAGQGPSPPLPLPQAPDLLPEAGIWNMEHGHPLAGVHQQQGGSPWERTLQPTIQK